MTKYINVPWPEWQDFMDEPYFNDSCIYSIYDSTYFIPEDLYNKHYAEICRDGSNIQ